jgi:hypothetical protein
MTAGARALLLPESAADDLGDAGAIPARVLDAGRLLVVTP